MKGASNGSSGPKSEKSGVKSSGFVTERWYEVFRVFLESDPGARQRAREVPLEAAASILHKEAREQALLSGIWAEFVDWAARWLADNAPAREARAVAWQLGAGVTLREAGERYRVDFRRLQELRGALEEAILEEWA